MCSWMQGLVWRSVLHFKSEAFVLYVQSLIDETNNNNQSESARNKFEGRLFIKSAVWLGFHWDVAMVLQAWIHLKQTSLWLKMYQTPFSVQPKQILHVQGDF